MKTPKEKMIPIKLDNEQLGYCFHYWEGNKKDERIFIASEIMKQLGYKGGRSVLANLELEEGIDMIVVKKKVYPEFFKQLSTLNVLGQRASNFILKI